MDSSVFYDILQLQLQGFLQGMLTSFHIERIQMMSPTQINFSFFFSFQEYDQKYFSAKAPDLPGITRTTFAPLLFTFELALLALFVFTLEENEDYSLFIFLTTYIQVVQIVVIIIYVIVDVDCLKQSETFLVAPRKLMCTK